MAAFYQRLAIDDAVVTAKNPSPASDTVSEDGNSPVKAKLPSFNKIPRTASMPDEVRRDCYQHFRSRVTNPFIFFFI